MARQANAHASIALDQHALINAHKNNAHKNNAHKNNAQHTLHTQQRICIREGTEAMTCTSTRFAQHTFTDVQLKDAFVAGFMHAACGHANDEFAETYRSKEVHEAWSSGHDSGTHYVGTPGWTTDAVASARKAYGHWRAEQAMREVVMADRNGAHR